MLSASAIRTKVWARETFSTVVTSHAGTPGTNKLSLYLSLLYFNSTNIQPSILSMTIYGNLLLLRLYGSAPCTLT